MPRSSSSVSSPERRRRSSAGHRRRSPYGERRSRHRSRSHERPSHRRRHRSDSEDSNGSSARAAGRSAASLLNVTQLEEQVPGFQNLTLAEQHKVRAALHAAQVINASRGGGASDRKATTAAGPEPPTAAELASRQRRIADVEADAFVPSAFKTSPKASGSARSAAGPLYQELQRERSHTDAIFGRMIPPAVTAPGGAAGVGVSAPSGGVSATLPLPTGKDILNAKLLKDDHAAWREWRRRLLSLQRGRGLVQT